MRELKFRVWFYDGKDHSTGEYLFLDEAMKEGIVESEYGNLHATDECGIIEQATGLYDRDGVEIYEGDIVEIIGRELTSEPLIVEYSQGDGKYEPFGTDDAALSASRCRVIGNIHENSGLLQ